MKKHPYLFLGILLLCPFVSGAQYHITSSIWITNPDTTTSCSNPALYTKTNSFNPGLTLKTYYLGGKSGISPVNDGGGFGFAICDSPLTSPGIYTIKQILFNGASAVDSVVIKHEYFYCNQIIIKCFNDALGTGIYDNTNDKFINMRLKLQVSLNGAIHDTITITSGAYYNMIGSIGDIYSLKVISFPSCLSLTAPVSGVIYDTVKAITNGYVPKYFGFKCSGTPGYDLSANAVIPVTGVHDQWGNLYVNNISCVPTNATVTLTFSPKYSYKTGYEHPTPSAVSGNTITWNLIGVTQDAPVDLYYAIWDDAWVLKAGDTVHETVTVTPTSGDLDLSNNTVIVIDTVRGGVDPNEMSVTPSGYIPSTTTQLKYTINFENTGNDTAFNISVYDTLSPYVDIRSLDLTMASAVMNIAVMNHDGYNIVKFDFPNINLLDSSHHGQCDGAVIFTINTKPGLPDGTKIDNRAGIYFDYNDVVMTNTVENIIGIPTGVATMNNASKTELYPNPVNDVLTIKTDNTSYNTLTITNTIGQLITTQSINTAQTKVNVKSLPAGMYYISLRGEGGVTVQKFEKL